MTQAAPLRQHSAEAQPARAGPIARWAVVAVVAAQVIRTLAEEDSQPRLPWYAGLVGAYLILFTLNGWKPRFPQGVLHGYLAIQSMLIWGMLAVNPELDSVTAFFVPLAFQAALLFAGPPLWAWVGILTFLTGASLVFYRGILEGLALAMGPAAFVVGLPAFMVANDETERARLRNQALLGELQETHRHLEDYAGQVEELANLSERSRLARELHDTVSQLVFTIVLTARSAQLLLRQGPSRVREQLERLRELSAGALAQLRSLISQMRP